MMDSGYPSKAYSARTKRLSLAIESAFNAPAYDVTSPWLETWLGLVDTPLEQYPTQLGLSMLAQLTGKISEAHTLMLMPPLPDETWDPKVRDCILSLTSDQRMVVVEFLQLRCELGDRAAQKAWTSVWQDIYEAGGDLSLAWEEPFATSPYLLSKRHRARVKRVEEGIRNDLLNHPSQPVVELPEDWEGLANTSLENYASELGLAMLASTQHGISPLPRMMLIPGFHGASEEKVRDRILSLTSDQRMAVAEFLRLRYDLGDAQRAWSTLWVDIYEAGGDMSLVWDDPFATSPYPSKRHRARVKRVEEAIRTSFLNNSSQQVAETTGESERLTSTPQEQYAGELGLTMMAQLQGRASIVEELMLIPRLKSILDTLAPSPRSGGATEVKVRECIMSLTSHQRMVVAEYLKLRCELGDVPAQKAWTCLWSDIYKAGGVISLVWD